MSFVLFVDNSYKRLLTTNKRLPFGIKRVDNADKCNVVSTIQKTGKDALADISLQRQNQYKPFQSSSSKNRDIACLTPILRLSDPDSSQDAELPVRLTSRVTS